MDYCQLTAHECIGLLEKKELSSFELTQSSLNRLEEVEEKEKAFVTVLKDDAPKRAKAIDEKIMAGEKLGLLAGIPLAIQDNICTQGVRTTCSSKMLANFVPPYNATVVEKTLGAGSIILGKTRMAEFGMGSYINGSAGVVANNAAIFAVGSDMGGENRYSAGLFGLVGLKPTYGLVSGYGLIASASSLEQIGPITKDVKDCALVLNLLAGYDPLDSTSVNMDYPDYSQFLRDDIQGIRIGLPREYSANLDINVQAQLKEAVKTLTDLGAIVEECSLPYTEYAPAAFQIIKASEASSNLARYDGVRFGYRTQGAQDVLSMFCRTRAEGFGSEVKEQIISGTYYLTGGNYETYYLKALKVRALIKQDFDEAFKKFDCLLTPIEQGASTIIANLAGIPALNIPFGLIDNQPMGIQLMGKAFSEGTLLKIAYALEQGRE